jgi:predicted dehydrogenase
MYKNTLVAQLRVGILGAGMMGEAHANAYRKNGAEIVAIADADSKLATLLAKRFEARACANAEDLFASGIDAISICLPHSLHREYGEAAATRGLHVLMEKPLATTLADACAIASAVRKSGVRMMLGFTYRFMQVIRQLHERIASGSFGKISLLIDYLSAGGPWPEIPRWYLDRSLAGGGILMIGSIHAVDRMRWLLGCEVITARCLTRKTGPGDVENVGGLLLEFESGACATISAYRSALKTHRRRHTLEVCGEEAEALVDLNSFANQSMTLTTAQGSEEIKIAEDDPFAAEIAEFINSIEEERDPVPGVSDGMESINVILAAYESARTGEAIKIRSFSE